MKIGTRIIFTLFMVIILAVCACIIVSALGFVDISHAEALLNGFLYTDYKYIWAGAAALIFVVGVILLFFRKKAEPKSVVVLKNEDGSVSITIDAIIELASRYLSGITGIVVEKIKISVITAGSIKVIIDLGVKQGVEIPAITAQIRTEIAEYILNYSGLTVNEVEIRVVPIKNQAAK